MLEANLRKGIRTVKLSGGMLAWLCVWVEVQISIWPSWCHCHSLSPAPVNLYWFTFLVTRVVPDKEPLNGCCCCSHISTTKGQKISLLHFQCGALSCIVCHQRMCVCNDGVFLLWASQQLSCYCQLVHASQHRVKTWWDDVNHLNNVRMSCVLPTRITVGCTFQRWADCSRPFTSR